eukprot:365138-Chlamydomonas_euryale.AAC.2
MEKWATTAPSDGGHGGIRHWREPSRCDLDVSAGPASRLLRGRCATGGGRLAVEGDRDCLLLGSTEPEYRQWPGYSVQTTAAQVTQFLRISWDRTNRIHFNPLGLAWACPFNLVGFQGSLDCAGSKFYSNKEPCAVESCLGLLNGALCNS